VHNAAAAAAAVAEQTRDISRALILPSVSNAMHRRYEKTVIYSPHSTLKYKITISCDLENLGSIEIY